MKRVDESGYLSMRAVKSRRLLSAAWGSDCARTWATDIGLVDEIEKDEDGDNWRKKGDSQHRQRSSER